MVATFMVVEIATSHNGTLNGKTIAQLLDDTKKNTTYLRRHVEVVEMWECQWKQEAKVPPIQNGI